MSSRTHLLALSLLAGCAGDEPRSPCYAPAPHSYAGTVRTLVELPEVAIDAIALPDGQVFAFSSEAQGTRLTGWRLDGSGAYTDLGTWEMLSGPMTVLANGRVAMIAYDGCRSVVLDPTEPGARTLRDCTAEHFYPEVLWQDHGGRLLMFGVYFPGGNDPEGGVFELDLAARAAHKLDVRPALSFGAPPAQPLQLCDGRVVFATVLHGSDFITAAPAIHQYDPATDQVTTIDLPYPVRDAVQLDTTTALALGIDSGEQMLFELDLETGATAPIVTQPGEVSQQFWQQSLVGLADGTALVVADDGSLRRYLPDERRLEPLGVAFDEPPRRLVRLSTGPVLAFHDDGRIDIFE